MAGIRNKNTKPEIRVRQILHRHGFRYRLHMKNLAGRPDIVLTKWNAVVFVHGCFWHRHKNCRYSSTPANRAEFWKKKFNDNIERDKRHANTLEAAGWRVAIVWECGLRGGATINTCEDLMRWLRSRDISRFEAPLITT